VEFDGRVGYVQPAYGGRPEDVLVDEKRREDLLRSVGVRFVRLVDDDLGRTWAPGLGPGARYSSRAWRPAVPCRPLGSSRSASAATPSA
jgi:hypothetical protein